MPRIPSFWSTQRSNSDERRAHVLQGKHAEPGESLWMLAREAADVIVGDTRHLHPAAAEQLGSGIVDADRRQLDAGCVHVREFRFHVAVAAFAMDAR